MGVAVEGYQGTGWKDFGRRDETQLGNVKRRRGTAFGVSVHHPGGMVTTLSESFDSNTYEGI